MHVEKMTEGAVMWDLVSLFISVVVLLLLLDIFVTPIGFLDRAKSVLGGKENRDYLGSKSNVNDLEKRVEELEKKIEALENKC